MLRQDGRALFAANVAALNSSSVVRGTRETTSCVAYRIIMPNFTSKNINDENAKDLHLTSKYYFTYRIYDIYRCKGL